MLGMKSTENGSLAWDNYSPMLKLCTTSPDSTVSSESALFTTGPMVLYRFESSFVVQGDVNEKVHAMSFRAARLVRPYTLFCSS